MPVRRVFVAFATILCFLSLGAWSVRAQGASPPTDGTWNEVGTLGSCTIPVVPYSYTASYFFGPENGMITTSVNGVVTIYFLVPVLQRMGFWQTSKIPAGLSYIRQIRFIQGKLYAASQGTDVLISSDSGGSWTYSGLGLMNANDVYADGTGAIRALTDPMKVFARLDTMHCIAQGTANIFVSSDGGLNWISSNVPMGDSISAGAFADRCENVYVCPNSWGTAWRSTNFGQTWQLVTTGSGIGPDFLNGASTVIYITDSFGMFRSTDDGLTWNSVITVDSGPHLPLFVFGPMGEHVVMPWVWYPFANPTCGVVDPVEMTTTGGLDDLHSGINMTDSNGAPLNQEDTLNVPWELASTCQPFKIPIAFWADVDGLSEKVTLYDSLGDIGLLGQDSISLPIHKEDTLWMQYDPHHPVSNAVLTFENHWHCSDWTETRQVHVVAVPAARLTAPPVFAASCRPDTEAAMIQIDSCQTLCIDSVQIPASIASEFHIAVSLPDTAWIGTRDSLLFVFTSQGITGSIFDSITVFGHYLGLDSILNDYFYFPHASGVDTDFSFFYTTIPVTLRSLPNGIALFSQDSSISLFRPSYCEHELDTTVTFTNKGCLPDTIEQVTLAGSGYSMANASLPIIVPPDSSVTFGLNFVGPDTGQFQGTLEVQAVSGDTKTFSIPLAGTGFPHAGALAANNPSLDAGPLYLCEERDTFAVIQDTGCDTVCVSGVSLSGTGFSITNGGGAFCVAPGESDTVWLRTQIDTTGGAPANNAVLTITSDAKPPLAPIALSREIEYPAAWGLRLSPPDSAAAGTDVTYEIIQTGSLPTDDTSIDLELVFYDDLLTLDTVDEAWASIVGHYRDANGMAHYHLHFSMPVSDSILATIHFTASQARELATALSLDSILFASNLSRPSDCIASAALANSEFAIRTSCDGPLLSEALGGLLTIDGISPNPTTGVVLLHYTLRGNPEVARIELEDALGRTILEQTAPLASGPNQSIALDLSKLPSGMYLTRLAMPGTTQPGGATLGVVRSARIIKE
ncbi:MAG TPA: hypothetical protein VFH95_02865 [Candidatus Kapabacteria bacterium]|nr:hypothetical protein [Candidatus Kapabacteria bacterium]